MRFEVAVHPVGRGAPVVAGLVLAGFVVWMLAMTPTSLWVGVLAPLMVFGVALAALGLRRTPRWYAVEDGLLLIGHPVGPPARYRIVGPVERLVDLDHLHRRHRGWWMGAAPPTTLTGDPLGPGQAERVVSAYRDTERLVRVGIAGGTVLVSPADPAAFLAAARAASR